ncbi:hypothetical protein VNI00_011666 [Paramarasmius palmivorus]|uniref:C2H2-type domain-containing protein n=1 Tax=Paramarasmius palmivorus TaxID=297713 RepID=A0AAW0CC17_9AGAR
MSTSFNYTATQMSPAGRVRKISLTLEDCLSQVYAGLEQKDENSIFAKEQTIPPPPYTQQSSTPAPTTSIGDWNFPSVDVMFSSLSASSQSNQQQFAPLTLDGPSTQAHGAQPYPFSEHPYSFSGWSGLQRTEQDWQQPTPWWQCAGGLPYGNRYPAPQPPQPAMPAWTAASIEQVAFNGGSQFLHSQAYGVDPSVVNAYAQELSRPFEPMDTDQQDFYLPAPELSEEPSEDETSAPWRSGKGKARYQPHVIQEPSSLPIQTPSITTTTTKKKKVALSSSKTSRKHHVKPEAHDELAFRRTEKRFEESRRKAAVRTERIQHDFEEESSRTRGADDRNLSRSANDMPLLLRCYKASCVKRFPSLAAVRSHAEAEHPGMASYRCPFGGCDLVAGSIGDIGRHEECLEHQEKQYKCLACARAYTRIDALKRHWVKAANHKKVHQQRSKASVDAVCRDGVWRLEAPNGYKDVVGRSHELSIHEVSHREGVRRRH